MNNCGLTKKKTMSLIVMIIIFFMVVLILACVPPSSRKVWSKPNFTQQEFAKDRYDCLQQSQQGQSSASGGYCTGYYCQPGQAQSSVITNDGLFKACMEARGWSLIDKQAVNQTGEEFHKLLQ